MKRYALRFALFAVPFTLLVGSMASAQDKVYYLDPKTKKEVDVSGEIKEEGPAGVKVAQGTTIKVIPALDITQITYDVPGLTATQFRRPDFLLNKAQQPDTKADERKMLLDEARRELERMAGTVGLAVFPTRYLQYRLAEVKYLQARADPTLAADAVDALKKFAVGYATSWEIVPCLKQLAALEEERNNVDGALAAYEQLADVPDVPKSIQRASSLLVVRLLMRRDKFSDAEGRLIALRAQMAPNEPEKPLVDVYLTQAQMAQNKLGSVESQLRAALKGTSDANVRATAHNVLGDYYLKKNQGEEAFWQYLRVDVMYSQDREQHAKALYQLWKLFDKVKNDPTRAEECYTRLVDKDFATTEFYQRAVAERKPPETPSDPETPATP